MKSIGEISIATHRQGRDFGHSRHGLDRDKGSRRRLSIAPRSGSRDRLPPVKPFQLTDTVLSQARAKQISKPLGGQVVESNITGCKAGSIASCERGTEIDT